MMELYNETYLIPTAEIFILRVVSEGARKCQVSDQFFKVQVS